MAKDGPLIGGQTIVIVQSFIQLEGIVIIEQRAINVQSICKLGETELWKCVWEITFDSDIHFWNLQQKYFRDC